MSSRVTWRINLFDEVAGRTAQAVDEGVRKTALLIQREAQKNIRHQRAIDTGALFNSAYTDTSKSSGRDKAAASAVGKSRTVKFAVPRGARLELGQARVAFAVEYAVYVELGVSNAFGKGIRLPARPFLHPAIDTVRSSIGTVIADEVRADFGKGSRSTLGGIDA